MQLTDEQVRKTIDSARTQIKADEFPSGNIRLMYHFGPGHFVLRVKQGDEEKTLQLGSEIAPAVNAYNYILSLLS